MKKIDRLYEEYNEIVTKISLAEAAQNEGKEIEAELEKYNKFEKVIDDRTVNEKIRDGFNKFSQWLVRQRKGIIAAMTCVILIPVLILSFSNNAFSPKPEQITNNSYQTKNNVVGFMDEDSANLPRMNANMQENSIDFNDPIYYIPSQMPLDFYIIKLSVADEKIDVFYMNNNNRHIRYSNYIFETSIYNDTYEIQIEKINVEDGYSFYEVRNIDTNQIIDFVFSLNKKINRCFTGNFSIEEAKQIISEDNFISIEN